MEPVATKKCRYAALHGAIRQILATPSYFLQDTKNMDIRGFALLGAFIYGQTRAFNPGYQLNYRLMCALAG